MNQLDWFKLLVEKRIQLNDEIDQYWQHFSNIDSWQFWFNFAVLVIPLMVLMLVLDRQRVFEIGFYGFAIHTTAIYLDTYGIKEGLWGYPFQISTSIASNFSLDSSLIPIIFMLIYQYTYHNRKLFYITTAAGIGFLAFVIKPLYERFGLFWMGPQMTYVKLSLFYITGILAAILILKLFHVLSNQNKS